MVTEEKIQRKQEISIIPMEMELVKIHTEMELVKIHTEMELVVILTEMELVAKNSLTMTNHNYSKNYNKTSKKIHNISIQIKYNKHLTMLAS